MSIQELVLQNSPQMNDVNSIINTVKSASNPNAVINQLIASNPLVKKASKVAEQYGGWEQATKAIAQQRGIAVDSVLKQLQGIDINSVLKQLQG